MRRELADKIADVWRTVDHDRNKECEEKDTLAVNDSKEEWDGDLMASNLMELLEITEIPPPRLPMGR